MKIVVFGLSVTSSWGNGHATLWRGLLRGLARLGHEAVFFERDVPYYAAHRDLGAGDGYAIALYPSWEEIAPTARAALARADAAIVTSFCPDARPACDAVLASKCQRVFYDLDTPVTLDALARGEDVPYLPSFGLAEFDLVLSYTGGGALDALARTLGARRTAPLYGSVDVALHKPTRARLEYACDLSYLGTYAADRQAGVEALFLESARRGASRTFVLGGALYPADMEMPANVRHLQHVAPPEHPAFYGSSTLTLSITRRAMARFGWCPSGRLFEAAACGTPIVSDTWDGLDAFFDPATEILIARSSEDVTRALELPRAQLAAMALRARARALSTHTAERRAAELAALLSE